MLQNSPANRVGLHFVHSVRNGVNNRDHFRSRAGRQRGSGAGSRCGSEEYGGRRHADPLYRRARPVSGSRFLTARRPLEFWLMSEIVVAVDPRRLLPCPPSFLHS
jgi:hypothetical protein